MDIDVRSPEAAGVECDHCNGTRFLRMHAWEVGNRWNPSTIPIAVWECEQCKLVALYPVPTAAQMPDNREWWSKSRRRFRRNRQFKVIWEKIRTKLFGEPAARLVAATRRIASEGRLLDVGAGMGPLMKHAKSHFNCVALEPSPIAAAELRSQGFEVIEATFEDAVIPDASFDVITLDSVIEHVASPSETLAKINRLLPIGGIVVLKTPKFGGPAYRLHKSEWNGFRHGHHTFLYSGATLGACLNKAGFEVVSTPRRDRMLDDILILWGRKVRDCAKPTQAKSA